MAITSALNPLVIKTELDSVFVQNYELPSTPGIATAQSADIFKQVSVDNGAHIEAILGGGGGLWEAKGEEAPVAQGSPRVANKVTYTVSTFAKALQLSKEFFDDNIKKMAICSA